MPGGPTTRFAPAPTGFLHLGHVVNAIYVWGLARARGARVLLRVEDHDRDRSRREYERALLDDLDWLGFVPDLFPTDAFRAGRSESRQSDREEIYEAAAARLAEAGLVYACDCSRRDIASASTETAGELRYPGTCGGLGLPLEPGRTWRVKMDPGTESFDDLLLGRETQSPFDQCGDLAIRDRLGQWTYQFAVSVDDHLQGITLVIRGLDLLPSTGRQIRLARLLGRAEQATFAHHPLVMKSPTQKLSKSTRDSGVRDLRLAGWSPDRVVAFAAAQAGIPDALWRNARAVR